MFLLLLLLHRLMLINPPPPQKKKKKNSESSPGMCCLGDQKLWIISRVLGDQKFWIHSCVVWEISNSGCSPVFFCKGWHLLMNCRLCSLRIKKLESLPVFYGEPSSRDKKFRQSFSCLNLKERIGDCLEEFDDSLQTGRRFLWVLTSA